MLLGCSEPVSKLSDVDTTLNNKVLMNYLVVASTFYVFRYGVIPRSESLETVSGQPRNTSERGGKWKGVGPHVKVGTCAGTTQWSNHLPVEPYLISSELIGYAFGK